MLLYISYICIFCALLLIFKKLFTKKFKFTHALITGGSSGIGLAIATELLKEGVHLTLVGRDKDKLIKAKKILDNSNIRNCKINCVALDISGDYELVKKCFEESEKNVGIIDLLINSAGFSVAAKFEDLTIEDFQKLIKVNYIGSVYCTRAVIRGMKERKKGSIAFISSQAGQAGIFGFTAYSASKFAIRGLAEALQMEMAPYNISICVAYPPDTNTPGFEEEMKTKPLETKLISNSSGFFEAEYVAKQITKSIYSGSFNCSIGIDGLLLSTISSALSPTNFLSAIFQIFTMGIFRFVGLLYLRYFYHIVNKCYKQNKLD